MSQVSLLSIPQHYTSVVKNDSIDCVLFPLENGMKMYN